MVPSVHPIPRALHGEVLAVVVTGVFSSVSLELRPRSEVRLPMFSTAVLFIGDTSIEPARTMTAPTDSTEEIGSGKTHQTIAGCGLRASPQATRWRQDSALSGAKILVISEMPMPLSETRLRRVVVMTFVAHNRKGNRMPAYARYISTPGNNFLSNTWRADSDATNELPRSERSGGSPVSWVKTHSSSFGPAFSSASFTKSNEPYAFQNGICCLFQKPQEFRAAK
jgi:hypothetical protein